jgi:beta-glucuronidase
MRLLALFLLSQLLIIELFAQQTHLSLRPSLSLNGQWKYIIDPYENGFYNYRYQPFDSSSTLPRNAFFSNSKPKDKSDLIEYDFDRSDSITVPSRLEHSEGKALVLRRDGLVRTRSFDHIKRCIEPVSFSLSAP